MSSFMPRKKILSPIANQFKLEYESYMENELKKVIQATEAICKFINIQKKKQIFYSKEEINDIVLKVSFKENLHPTAASEMLTYIHRFNKFLKESNENNSKEGEVLSAGEYFVLHGNAGAIPSTHSGTILTPNASMRAGEGIWLSEK